MAKKAETCRTFTTCLYIRISNCASAVTGIYTYAVACLTAGNTDSFELTKEPIFTQKFPANIIAYHGIYSMHMSK
jgi:uncharacterized protein YqkB